MSKPRFREHRIEIKAPLSAVWKALVEAEEVTRWWAPEVEIDAREGGRYWVSWGEGMGGHSRIEVLEPEKRLVLVHAWEPAAKLDPPMMEEYILESDGDVTILRLVQSGIPATSEWDSFYEDTGRGWKMFLAGLRHYLERHLGQARDTIMFMQPVSISLEDAWQKLIGPDGLAVGGGLEAARAGERATLTTAFGQKLEVEVLVHEPPHTLSMRIDNLEDSLLELDFEGSGGKMFLYANLATFGVSKEQVDELRGKWTAWMNRLFPRPAEAEGESA